VPRSAEVRRRRENRRERNSWRRRRRRRRREAQAHIAREKSGTIRVQAT
jgi:hypothetical protein